MSEQKFIMTAFGKDLPGVVADVTEMIYEYGCNLEDSTMTRLEDEFTMIFLCAGQGENLEATLTRACRRLEREKGISVFLRPVEGPTSQQKRGVSIHKIHVEGIDHAGIVYRISQYLSQHQINIADLQSKLSHSPGTGTAMYLIEMHVEVPNSLSIDDIQAGLHRVGDELHVDIQIARA
jgi:glycine cleavage system transcriptional repressor